MSRMQLDLSGSAHQRQASSPDGTKPGMLRRVLSRGRLPHVCVVGAGFAGLRCADILLQHGVKVTVLEARNRVGGRLYQGRVNGHLVDLGPNWIHGTDNNPILDLARETNTSTHAWSERNALFDPLGHMIPEEEAAEYYEKLWGIIGDAFKHSEAHSATIPATMSLFDFFQEESKDVVWDGDVSREDAEKKRKLLLEVAKMWGAFVGGSVEKQSLKFFWLEECIEGENLFVAETYQKVLKRVAQPALDQGVVHFGKKVTKIVSGGNQEGKALDVVMSEGERRNFDAVVMTAPLGWLKRNRDVFDPPIPARLSQAIDAIGYGNLDKVYITFPSAFWDTPTSEPNTLRRIRSASQQNVPNTTAITKPLHQSEAATSSPDSHYPGFTQWTSPHYAESTNPHHWNIEGMNLAAMPPSCAHPTILFYIFGPCAQHVGSIIRDNPDQAATDRALLAFFEPYYSRLPNYNDGKPDCHPTGVLATAWANDELAGYGSYCNFQVGLERGDEDVEVMREGMPERGVWLGGEHTAPFVALGTVTGAYWAGEGVARRILGAYGIGGMREGDGSALEDR